MIFAKVRNQIVIDLMVADQEFMDNFIDTSAGQWIETKEDGSIRKNYAGIGYTYDETKNAFIAPQPYESWTLNKTTFKWKPPVSMPSDNKNYIWNETDQQWDEIT